MTTSQQFANPLRPTWRFDFVWVHPPYWRQKVYSADKRDMSTAPTPYFLYRYRKLMERR